jgi:hypothetical protein
MRVMRCLKVLPVALILALPGGANAQSPEDEVAAAVGTLFDAMRAGDGATVHALFHPDARLMSVSTRDGQTVLTTTAPTEFARAVGTPRTEIWDERIGPPSIRVDGALATAWMDYAFYLDDRFSHCGVNAFQWVRGDNGWQILQITVTRRPVACGAVAGAPARAAP